MEYNIMFTSDNLLLGSEILVSFKAEISYSPREGKVTIDSITLNPAPSSKYSRLLNCKNKFSLLS